MTTSNLRTFIRAARHETGMRVNRAASKTTYEWDLETVDEYGDVVDHHHEDDVSLIIGGMDSPDHALVLVKDIYDQDGEARHRAWAYVENGKLPDVFDDGSKMPKRFADEFKKAKRAYLGEAN